MSNFSVQTALVVGVTGFLLTTTAGELLESAYAQGCRPVAPGCRIEGLKNAHGGGGQGQTEICN